MATKAMQTFRANIKRAGYFLDLHEAHTDTPGAPTLPLRELPRAAVVFAVGALDAYLAELSAEIILHQVTTASTKSDTRAVLKRVQADLPTMALEVALLSSSSDRLQYVRDQIAQHFYHRVSLFGADGVADVLARMGVKVRPFWDILASKGFDSPAAELDKWTAKRHDIIHEGKSPRAPRGETRSFVELVRVIAVELDSLASRQR